MMKVTVDVGKVAPLWKTLDKQFRSRDFIEGERFTIADIVLGAFAKRWFGLPDLERWYLQLATRASFRKYVDFELT